MRCYQYRIQQSGVMYFGHLSLELQPMQGTWHPMRLMCLCLRTWAQVGSAADPHLLPQLYLHVLPDYCALLDSPRGVPAHDS